MKTWQKIAVTLALGVALFSVIAILVLLSVLPDPTTVGRSLGRRAPPAADTTSTNSNASSQSSNPEQQQPRIAPLESAAREPSKDPAPRIRQVRDAFFERYMSDARMESRVCENLAGSSASFKSTKEFYEQLSRSLLGESAPSATVEAIMLPIEYTLKNEAVRELAQAAREAADRGNTGVLEKAQFYALATRAMASVVSSRAGLETVSANAHRLFALSRAASLKSEILQDPDMPDLCRGFERSAVDGIARDDIADRDRMARMFARHGISNEAIEYNPNAETGVRFTRGPDFELEIPWMEEIFKKK